MNKHLFIVLLSLFSPISLLWVSVKHILYLLESGPLYFLHIKSSSLICRCSPFPRHMEILTLWSGGRECYGRDPSGVGTRWVMEEMRPPPLCQVLWRTLGLVWKRINRSYTAGRSKACHRIAQGEELKLQLVLPFNDRSNRPLETRRVRKQTGLVNEAEGLWQILGDDGDKWFWGFE